VPEEDNESRLIRYDKMQGRPSVEVTIQNRVINCLLDTGARINVISEVIFQKLIGLELRESRDILRCANNSQLLILGKTTVPVQINQIKKWWNSW